MDKSDQHMKQADVILTQVQMCIYNFPLIRLEASLVHTEYLKAWCPPLNLRHWEDALKGMNLKQGN